MAGECLRPAFAFPLEPKAGPVGLRKPISRLFDVKRGKPPSGLFRFCLCLCGARPPSPSPCGILKEGGGEERKKGISTTWVFFFFLSQPSNKSEEKPHLGLKSFFTLNFYPLEKLIFAAALG